MAEIDRGFGAYLAQAGRGFGAQMAEIHRGIGAQLAEVDIGVWMVHGGEWCAVGKDPQRGPDCQSPEQPQPIRTSVPKRHKEYFT